MNRNELFIILLIILVIIYCRASKEGFEVLNTTVGTNNMSLQFYNNTLSFTTMPGTQLVLGVQNDIYPLRLSSGGQYIYTSYDGKTFTTFNSPSYYPPVGYDGNSFMPFMSPGYQCPEIITNGQTKYYLLSYSGEENFISYYNLDNTYYLVVKPDGNFTWSLNFNDASKILINQ